MAERLADKIVEYLNAHAGEPYDTTSLAEETGIPRVRAVQLVCNEFPYRIGRDSKGKKQILPSDGFDAPASRGQMLDGKLVESSVKNVSSPTFRRSRAQDQIEDDWGSTR